MLPSVLRRGFLTTAYRLCSSSPSSSDHAAATRPSLDFDYLLDTSNLGAIKRRIVDGKGVGDIDRVRDAWAKIERAMTEGDAVPTDAKAWRVLWDELYEQAGMIPNRSHPDAHGDEVITVRTEGSKPTGKKGKAAALEVISHKAQTLRRNMAVTGGDGSYAMVDGLARIQQALLDYTVDFVLETDPEFQLVHVPDILPVDIAQSCGLQDRSAAGISYVFAADRRMCLSGTGELGVAAFLANRKFTREELPAKFLAVTRCYRPEAHGGGGSRGRLYRVHEFLKAEMFVVTAEDLEESKAMLGHIVDIQQKLYTSLDLHYKLQRMPVSELGAPAFEKFDVEAWMCGRGVYGEISSASNCTDYQSRRLHITVEGDDGRPPTHVHTVNGTACAATRLLIAVVEHAAFATDFELPSPLHRYLPKEPAEQRLMATMRGTRTNLADVVRRRASNQM